VRRTGGLRGPHANANGPAPEGEARRQLLATRKDAEARPARSRPARRNGKPDLRSDRRTRCSTGAPIMHLESMWKDLVSDPTVVRPWWRRRESAERQEGSDRSDAERLPTRRILRGEVRIAGKHARVRSFGIGGRAAETR